MRLIPLIGSMAFLRFKSAKVVLGLIAEVVRVVTSCKVVAMFNLYILLQLVATLTTYSD